MKIQKLDRSGFSGKQEGGTSKFIPPCVFYFSSDLFIDKTNGSASSVETKKVAHQSVLIHIKFINSSLVFPFVILALQFMSVMTVSGGATKDASDFYLHSS